MTSHRWDALKKETIRQILRAVQHRDLPEAIVKIRYLTHILETENLLKSHSDTLKALLYATTTQHDSSSP